jgi:hypothetical protein
MASSDDRHSSTPDASTSYADPHDGDPRFRLHYGDMILWQAFRREYGCDFSSAM